MKLHRNAALSWSGRRLLTVRVLEQGWTLTAAAEAAGVSVRGARKWVGRLSEVLTCVKADNDLGLFARLLPPVG